MQSLHNNSISLKILTLVEKHQSQKRSTYWRNVSEKMNFNYKYAHQHSSNHRKVVLESDECGCFYCLSVFKPTEIEEWVDEDDNGIGQTAICPRCGIDSVIGNKSGVPIKKDFLKAMQVFWFG
jgi:hypothetical protein